MKRSKRIVPVLFALAMAIGLSPVAPAQAALITASNFNPPLNGSGLNTIGNLIQIGATPITINALGVQDTGAADGIIGNVPVGLWTADGSSLLASVTVPSGTSGILLDDYRYVLLGSSITLTANTQYLIGALSSGSTTNSGTFETAGEGFNDPTTSYIGGTGVTILASRFSGGGFAAPLSSGGAQIDRWGHGNATFFAVIPTPAALPAGLGLLGLLTARRRR